MVHMMIKKIKMKTLLTENQQILKIKIMFNIILQIKVILVFRDILQNLMKQLTNLIKKNHLVIKKIAIMIFQIIQKKKILHLVKKLKLLFLLKI